MMYSMKTVAALVAIVSGSASAFTFAPTAMPNTISQLERQSRHLPPLVSFVTHIPSSTTTVMLASDSSTEETAGSIDLLGEVDAIFATVDKNGDGQISLEELRAHLVEEMGYTQDYTEYLFASIDTDSDGTISKEELKFAFYNFEALSMYMTFGIGGADITNRSSFKNLALKSSSAIDPEARDKLMLDDLADLIFDIIDTDKSGEITKEELQTHFESVTSKLATAKGEDSATDAQAQDYVQTMFATLDVDKDGGICREEVRTAFQKYDFKLLARTFGLRVYRTAEV